MQEQIEKLIHEIKQCYKIERNTIFEINEIGASDADPQRDSKKADRIRQLEAVRVATKKRRLVLQRGLAELRGRFMAILNREKKRSGNVNSIIKAALDELN